MKNQQPFSLGQVLLKAKKEKETNDKGTEASISFGKVLAEAKPANEEKNNKQKEKSTGLGIALFTRIL